MYSVYLLKHPETNNVVYVGVTTNPKSRLDHHRCNHGVRYNSIDIIEQAENREEGLTLEKKWIRHYSKIGCPLINIRCTNNGALTIGERGKLKKFMRKQQGNCKMAEIITGYSATTLKNLLYGREASQKTVTLIRSLIPTLN